MSRSSTAAEREHYISQLVVHVVQLTEQRDQLLAALKGVVRVADRKTDEFDAARRAIAKTEKVEG